MQNHPFHYRSPSDDRELMVIGDGQIVIAIRMMINAAAFSSALKGTNGYGYGFKKKEKMA